MLQGAVELNDEGAALLASACKLLQGPTGTELTPEQCRFVNIDFLVSFWLVSSLNLPYTSLRLSVKRSRPPDSLDFGLLQACHLPWDRRS